MRPLALKFLRTLTGSKTRAQPHPRPLLVPVALGVPVECREHDGEDSGSIVTYQAHDVLIVPVIESTLCHLVGTDKTLGILLALLKTPLSVWETSWV